MQDTLNSTAPQGRTGPCDGHENHPRHRLSGLLLHGIIGLFALLLVALTPAQSHAQSYNFSGFSVEGNQYVDDSTVLAHAAIRPGKTLSAAQLNEAYRRVLASGLFRKVVFRPSGRQLRIIVEEYPIIGQISIEGNRKISDDVAMKAIGSTPRRVFSPSQAEQDARKLAALYRDRGLAGASVIPRIIERGGNRVDLVFEVHEGGRVEIERISFLGNHAFSERRLRRVLATKQAGLLRALIRRDSFVEDRIELDKTLLTDFYRARGYVDFQVLSVAAQFSRERNAFFLTFSVQEGQKYRIGDVTTTSEVKGVNADEFAHLARLRKGQTYSPEDIARIVARMERLALRKGLNLVRVDPRITRNTEDLSLDVNFALVRGPRVFVERIDIEGNTTTLDRVIRRQFHIAEGDPFNPREIREAAARIEALRLFASSDVSARQGTAADRVIVDVKVEEQNTGSLRFGAAYNFTTGVGFTAKFSERNFMGRGQTLNFDATIGLDNANGGFTFIEPAFLGRDIVFQLDGEYRQTQFDYTNYDTRKVLLRPSFGFALSEKTRLALRFGAGSNRILNVDPGSSPVLHAEAALGTRSSRTIGYTLSYDSRGKGLNPDAGMVLSFGQDFAGFGGDVNYIKTTARLGAEMKLLNGDVTLRATLEGGRLDSLGGVSSLNDRFFLTSANLRGFAPAGVGPRDLTVANRDALGGNSYAAARFETEFPLGLPSELGITGGVFYDIGSLWGLDNTNGGAIDDSRYMRSSVGVSLFWKTPIGPLRFNYTKALQYQPYDKLQSFDVTISTEF